MVTRTQYDDRGRFIIALTGTNLETSTSNSLTGLNETKTNSNGTQKWSYDGFGRIAQYSNSQGNVVNMRYRYCGATAARCPRYAAYFVDQTDSDPDRHLFTYFNAHGLIVATETLIRKRRKITETRAYDDRDNLVRYCRLQDDTLLCRERTYDLLGRPVKEFLGMTPA